MAVTKYNPQTGRATLYRVPDGAVLMSDDMEKIVPCANCCRLLKFGDTYTSRTILTQNGFGYPVCESCYEQEMRENQ